MILQKITMATELFQLLDFFRAAPRFNMDFFYRLRSKEAKVATWISHTNALIYFRLDEYVSKLF